MPLICEGGEPPRVVVCLTGYQGHGKTEVARYLERERGFYRAPFAEPIRAMLVASGVPTSAFGRDRKDEPCDVLCGATPREAMETLGAWGRALSPVYWARAWARRVAAAGDPPQVVVDDARFDLETAYAMGEAGRRRAGFLLVHVLRPDRDRGTGHESNRLPAVPNGADVAIVRNDADLGNLWAAVDAVMRERGYL